MCKIKVKKESYVIITIIIKYASICLNKQGSEYAKVLNISEPFQTAKMEHRGGIIIPLTDFIKPAILDVCWDSG